MKTIKCEECGKKIEIGQSFYEGYYNGDVFCSQECALKYNFINLTVLEDCYFEDEEGDEF